MNTLISRENVSPDALPCCFLLFLSFKSSPCLIISPLSLHPLRHNSFVRSSFDHLLPLLYALLPLLLFFLLQGTVNNQTGIFPETFVKIIKPLPESDSEGESGGHTYSCLRCFLLTPSGVDTRSV